MPQYLVQSNLIFNIPQEEVDRCSIEIPIDLLMDKFLDVKITDSGLKTRLIGHTIGSIAEIKTNPKKE